MRSTPAPPDLVDALHGTPPGFPPLWALLAAFTAAAACAGCLYGLYVTGKWGLETGRFDDRNLHPGTYLTLAVFCAVIAVALVFSFWWLFGGAVLATAVALGVPFFVRRQKATR